MIEKILKIDFQNFHIQKVYHEHFSQVYTMKLSPNTYFMKCSERNISQCILALMHGLKNIVLGLFRYHNYHEIIISV